MFFSIYKGCVKKLKNSVCEFFYLGLGYYENKIYTSISKINIKSLDNSK